MKIFTVSFVLLLAVGLCGNGFAQNVPGVPNGSIANNSRDDYDNGTRIRSMEMERIKKEGYRSAAAAKSAENRKINYFQIKKDFELLQKLETEIVKTYITGKQINYKRISETAYKLNECAQRLQRNLSFSDEKSVEKANKNKTESENVKDIIVILDTSVGKFVVNPVFKNLNVFETKDAAKAELDLQNIIRLSRVLAQKAENQI